MTMAMTAGRLLVTFAAIATPRALVAPAADRLTVRSRGPEAITVKDALASYSSIVAPGTRVLSVPLGP